MAIFEQILMEAVERFGDVELAKRVTMEIFLAAYDEINAARSVSA